MTPKPAICTAVAVFFAAAPAFSHDNENLHRIEAFFADAVLLDGPNVVDCTLSKGTRTECFSITVAATPQSFTPGPWCPTSISDGADKGGIWMKDGEVHDVDGQFIRNLATLYGDTRWQLFDEQTGEIRYTGTLEACQAAARPDVAEEYNNYCVQCLPEYMPEDAKITYVIPLKPQNTVLKNDVRFAGSGVAYNGVRLDGPAPLDAIIGAHTIAPFDDCGGHVNPHVGYHYHAVTDCLEDAPEPARDALHGGQIGVAMDGYPILPHLMADGSAAEGLDRCNGHDQEGMGYHYHAGAPGSNAILGCLKAEAGCVLSGDNANGVCDASARPPRP